MAVADAYKLSLYGKGRRRIPGGIKGLGSIVARTFPVRSLDSCGVERARSRPAEATTTEPGGSDHDGGPGGNLLPWTRLRNERTNERKLGPRRIQQRGLSYLLRDAENENE